jgi:3-oxoadipate enol-lactonase
VSTFETSLGPIFVDDQGKPNEPAALLWPSLFTDHRMWRYQIDPLRKAGLRTLALDPPGQGQSPGLGRRFTMAECAEAALQILEAADVQAPTVILGTSWGGFVAPRIALRAPERVRGIVMTNTSAERGSEIERIRAHALVELMRIRALDKTFVSMTESALLSKETRRQNPQIGSELAKRMQTWDRRTLIATVRSVLIDRDPVLDSLSQVNIPSLVISGKEDRTLPSIHSQRIAEQLQYARHVVVAGAAHLVPLEKPDEANSLILEFLNQLPST